MSVGDGPLEVLWLEGNFFLFSVFLVSWWLISSLVIAVFFGNFDWSWWWHWEFFINNLILSDKLSLKLELEANDGGNLSNDLLNAEKLIHESQLKLIIELGELL